MRRWCPGLWGDMGVDAEADADADAHAAEADAVAEVAEPVLDLNGAAALATAASCDGAEVVEVIVE